MQNIFTNKTTRDIIVKHVLGFITNGTLSFIKQELIATCFVQMVYIYAMMEIG